TLICGSRTAPGAIKLWNVEKGIETGLLHGHSAGIRYLAISPDGSLLASGTDIGELILWDLQARSLRIKFPGSSPVVLLSMAFSPDARYLAVSDSSSETINVFDTVTLEISCSVPIGSKRVRHLTPVVFLGPTTLGVGEAWPSGEAGSILF